MPSPCTASRRCRPDFTRVPYANPAAPKGGRLVQGVLGTFDSLNPLIVKGTRPLPAIRGYVVESLMARGYDEPFTLYGLLAATVETDDARSYVTFHLDPAARFSDGKPVTPDGRHLLLAAAARQGPAQPSHLLRQGRQGRGDRRARGALRSRRQQRPRAAADPRPDAGAGQARGQSRDLRGDVVRAADRQRPLRRRRGRSRQERHAQAQSRLLGPRSRDQSRLLEFRRDPLRLLPRGQLPFRGVQARPLRRAHRARSGALADRLRFSGRARRPRGQGGVPDRPAEGELLFRLQHAPADLRRHPRARGDLAAVRFRMDQPQLFLRSLPAHRRAISRAPNCRRTAGRRTRASARCSRRFPDAVRADVLDGTWSPPVSDGSGRDRATLQARARPVRGRRLRAARHRAGRARRAAGRSPSRSWSRRGTRSGSRSCSRRASSAPASRRACARSTPCSSRRAAHLRFRHDPEPLGPVAVARQRAGVLLGLGRRRRQRHPQLHGRQERRGRRHDRRAAQGARAATISSPPCARSTAC